MKYKITLLFVLAVLIINTSSLAQVDTFAYAKNFELQKSQYAGLPMSSLLSNMGGLQFLSVFSGINVKNKYHIPYSTFFFEAPGNRFYQGVIGVTIHWQTPILSTDVQYYRNRNHAYFTNEERQFYGTKIIKDIKVYRR
ncbi:MAG TPA: hypothetical protein PK504_06715 [Ferruginibacter sp.]|nr:hypothetical protein [Ferruginibacter sp.]HRE63760.1 hypothetical protein [Ferruginibacter sp.]